MTANMNSVLPNIKKEPKWLYYYYVTRDAINKESIMPSNINKAEALSKINELEKQIKELRVIVEKPEPPLSPLFIPNGKHYYYLNSMGGVGSGSVGAGTAHTNRPSFRTEQDAKDFAEAIAVMLELRVQPGVVPTLRGISQYYIKPNSNQKELRIEGWTSGNANLGFSAFCPPFASPQEGEAAIHKVGESRILAAMKTLAWCME